jgi:FtsP/CotA-like multicopper oxidase with cupredoxin domain
MHTFLRFRKPVGLLMIAVLLMVALVASSGTLPAAAQLGAAEDGIICTNGPSFTLTTRTGYIGTPDGNVVYMWGFSAGNDPFQHPSPVLCVNQGDTVTIILHNTLSKDVSITFPGQENVLANGAPAQPQFDSLGTLTSLTNVAPANGGSVTYSFTASRPGTFIYQSGTNPAVQVRMGLFGALVVRPMDGQNFAYNDSTATVTSEFNQALSGEVLLLESEVDPALSQAVELNRPYNLNNYRPRYWLVNGRGFPDTVAPNFASWLPSQPYGALAHVEPTDATNPLPYLERFLNVSSQPLPFHPHGKNGVIIGQDGYPLRSASGGDLSYERFALVAAAGQTYDSLFHWHNREGYNPASNPVPVVDPGWANLQYGMYYSGSPYLGEMGPMPPGMTSQVECGEFYIIAHNHALHQLTSWGVPMTGPATFMRVDPPGGCAPMP